MAYSFCVGSMRCHLLSDGVCYQDGGASCGLVPRVLWERFVHVDEKNRMKVQVHSLLIESEDGLVLVDTGWGDKLPEKRRAVLGVADENERLVSDLARVGYAPEDVSTVVLTHLHADHAGGATRFGEHETSTTRLVPTFANARHLCQGVDLAAANAPNERTRATYDAQNWEVLEERGQLCVCDGAQSVAKGVRTEIAPGHTEALQVVWVESAGESLLFASDACSFAIQLEKLAWVPAFDILPMQSIETKRALRSAVQRQNSLVVFQHDANMPLGRFEGDALVAARESETRA